MRDFPPSLGRIGAVYEVFEIIHERKTLGVFKLRCLPPSLSVEVLLARAEIIEENNNNNDRLVR